MSPALIFDCDGVLADTERDGHRVAFNRLFAERSLGVEWGVEEYGALLRIGGGKERMATLLTPAFCAEHGLPADGAGRRALLEDWHARKSAIYRELVAAGRLPARPGVARLVDDALAAGWELAVASTSAEASVRAVLEHVVGPERAAAFTAILGGESVEAKKPAPDVYRAARARLRRPEAPALVIEDMAIGLQAARAAGLPCLVTTSAYTELSALHGAAAVVSSLGDPGGPPARLIAGDPALVDGDLVTLGALESWMGCSRAVA